MCVIGSEADTAGQGTHVFVHPKSTWPQLCKHWGYPHEGAVTEDNLAEKTLTSFYAQRSFAGLLVCKKNHNIQVLIIALTF